MGGRDKGHILFPSSALPSPRAHAFLAPVTQAMSVKLPWLALTKKALSMCA